MADRRVPEAAADGPDRWGEALGLEILEATPTRVTARVEAEPQHRQLYGIIHEYM